MTAKDKIVFRKLDESEIDKAVSFYSDVQGDEKTAEQWRWEYRGCYPELYAYGVAETEGRIIGVQGMIPVMIDIDGEQVLSSKSEDSLIHPDHRGGDTFARLYDSVLERLRTKDVRCVWGFTAANRVWREKLGFTVHEGCMGYSVRVINLSVALKKFSAASWPVGKKLFMYCMAAGSYCYGLAFDLFGVFRRSLRNRFTVTENVTSDDDIQNLYDRVREHHPGMIFIVQNKKYLDWRLGSNPDMEYERRYVYENGVLKAYCYIGVSKKDPDMLVITDIMAEDDDAGYRILQEIMKMSRRRKTGLVFFLGNRKNMILDSLFRMMGSFGFVTMTYPVSFVFKDLDACSTAAGDISNWYTTALWTEGLSL